MPRFRVTTNPKKRREMREVFSTIHDTMAWGEGESRSGPGSTRDRAAAFLPDLISLVQSLRIGTLLDAPCGDFTWAGPLADAVDRYTGVDVVPGLIAQNRRRWGAGGRQFLCRDIVTQRLPRADLVLCRDALVHLSCDDIFATISNFRRSGSTYLLTTTFVGERANEDIATGGWRPLNLERAPYSFPEPLHLIDERCHHTGGIYADKRLALWRLSELP